MFQLFNRIYLDHIDNLNGEHDRIVVGKEAADEYLGSSTDILAKELGITDLPKTWRHTQDGEAFIAEEFPKLLPQLAQTDQKVVIYCDDDVLVGLFVFWMKHVFPEVTYAQLQELYFIFNINRSFSEPEFDWQRASYLENRLKRHYHVDVPVRSDVVEFVAAHKDNLPLEYQLIGFLSGDTDMADVAGEVRERLRRVLTNIVTSLDNRLRFLYYSAHLETILGGAPTKPGPGKDPLREIDGLHLSGVGPELYDQLSDPDFLAEFKAQYIHDQRRLQKTFAPIIDPEANLQELLLPVTLLEIQDDTELLSGYLNGFRQVDRFTLLVPGREMRTFTMNLLFWVQQCKRNAQPVIRPAWVVNRT